MSIAIIIKHYDTKDISVRRLTSLLHMLHKMLKNTYFSISFLRLYLQEYFASSNYSMIEYHSC